MKTKRLLIIVHCPSGNLRRLAQAAFGAARDPLVGALDVRLALPGEVGAKDVLESDALLLGSTENFGYMAGAIKDFFERIYYTCLEKTQGRPYALWVRAGQDGAGAQSSIERIVSGLRWRAVQPPLILRGAWDEGFIEQVRGQSMTLAAGVAADLF